MTLVVSAFYKFVRIDDAPLLRAALLDELSQREMKGTILIASEGINGTISGSADAMTGFMAGLRADPRFSDLATKAATADVHPFQRLKVKVKRAIITFGPVEADPSVRVGTYVAPEDWNALISEPDVLVLDTRNAYEVAAGTFAGAVDPKTRTFSELPAFVEAALEPERNPRIAMFCTGGIRCEKASAYLKSLGFPEVYHLKGGILAYLGKVPPEQSLFAGECFVFDERETVDGVKRRE